MKCNKCLKKIPEGEEIRYQYQYKEGRGCFIGGCMCETCWKDSKMYKVYTPWREDDI